MVPSVPKSNLLSLLLPWAHSLDEMSRNSPFHGSFEKLLLNKRLFLLLNWDNFSRDTEPLTKQYVDCI